MRIPTTARLSAVQPSARDHQLPARITCTTTADGDECRPDGDRDALRISKRRSRASPARGCRSVGSVARDGEGPPETAEWGPGVGEEWRYVSVETKAAVRDIVVVVEVAVVVTAAAAVVVVVVVVVLAYCYATVTDIRKNAARLWPVIELGRVTDAQCDRPVPSDAAGAESARGRVRGAGATPGCRLDSPRGSPPKAAARRSRPRPRSPRVSGSTRPGGSARAISSQVHPPPTTYAN